MPIVSVRWVQGAALFRGAPGDNDAADLRGAWGPCRQSWYHSGGIRLDRVFRRVKVGWPRRLKLFHVLRSVEQLMKKLPGFSIQTCSKSLNPGDSFGLCFAIIADK